MDVRTIARTGLGITVLVLLGAACQDPSGPVPDTPLEPASVALSSHASGTVPFRLSGGAVLVAQNLAPGFPAEKSDFDGRCSTPSDFVISFRVSAEAAHLGHLTGDFEHCTRIDFATGASTLADGVAVITAANGDQLWATYRSADAPMGEFDEQFQFDGGTGRFEHASGEALASAVCDRATGTCTFDAYGTLVYDASDRSAR